MSTKKQLKLGAFLMSSGHQKCTNLKKQVWQQKNGYLRQQEQYDAEYRFVYTTAYKGIRYA